MSNHVGASSSGPQSTIHIYAINARLNSSRSLRSIKLSVNNSAREALWKQKGKDGFSATFESPLDISSSDNLTLQLRSSYKLGISDKDTVVDISADRLLAQNANEEGHRREWKQTFEKVEIKILLANGTTSRTSGFGWQQQSAASSSNQSLIPTTDDITRICPRFRILLVGKVGVGKSSLINRAFGVTDALVSHSAPGLADINREILSKGNPRFVLHDSQGFEPGEVDNFQRVRDFIQTRNQMPELKDQLHAIWICFATPVAGGRIFETGVEEFLKLKNGGALGNVPIIAVFTKFDELVDREDRNLDPDQCDDLSDEEIAKLARENAEKAFEKDCIGPFQRAVGTKIPYKAVSTTEGYETTFSDLIQITFDNVKQHVAGEASIVTAIAQKVNPSVKIDGSIAVGKSRYWAGLASGMNFPGKKLSTCLDVIHTDIVNVWNFDDPKMNLQSNEFKALMSHLVIERTGAEDTMNPNKSLTTGLVMLGTVAGVVGALSGPAAPIVIPIVGGCVLAKWMYDVYQASHGTLEHVMAYIIDLTLVMQNIFWLVDGKHPTSRRLIKLAFKAYLESDIKGVVHCKIARHVKEVKLYSPGARDTTLEKIIEIINLYRIDSVEMFALKSKIPPFDPSVEDEPWDT